MFFIGKALADESERKTLGFQPGKSQERKWNGEDAELRLGASVSFTMPLIICLIAIFEMPEPRKHSIRDEAAIEATRSLSNRDRNHQIRENRSTTGSLAW